MFERWQESSCLAFKYIQFQRLEWSVASRLPARQKAPLRQKLHPPSILNGPLLLLDIIQFQWPALRI
ncbi:hypothetical protein [Bacillus thuringiensis]|uniref:hypothetical protein n=1 Tax=Bacillus thuringiensis TaxID=1428 RepID=UPI001642BC25|nr:hypothetical protein [Bacillus thuringiensis]